MKTICYRNLYFPASIVRHAAWLYARFNFRLCDAKVPMAERGVEVSYKTVRRWMARPICPINRVRSGIESPAVDGLHHAYVKQAA